MKIASYCRVSTDEQAERGFSIDEQKERNEKWCKDRGYAPPIHYIDDGYSAKNTKRPDYQRLMNDVKKKQYGIVISTKTDRLTRNLLDLLNAVDYLDRYDCRYHSVSEDIDVLTAPGKLQLQVLGMFAEFERNRISENVQNTMKSIARKSGVTKKAFTVPCYGYDVKDGIYVINEQEAEGVKLAVSAILGGAGMRGASLMLSKSGYKTRKGLNWHQTTLRNLLIRETLTGKLIYNRTYKKNGKRYVRPEEEWIIIEDHHPAILDEQTWNDLQHIMRGRQVGGKQSDNERWLLSGLVRCGACGSTMKGHMVSPTVKNRLKKTYYRYVCSAYQAKGECFYHHILRDDLENYLIEQIKDVAAAGDIKTVKLNVVKSKEDERKQIETKFKRLDQRIQKQIEAYEDDLISAADLKKARERVEDERKTLHEALERLDKGDPSSDQDTVKQSAKRVLHDVLSGDRLTVKNAFRQIIHSITIHHGETVEIIWNM